MLEKSFTEILSTLDKMSNEEKFNVCRVAIRAFNNIAQTEVKNLYNGTQRAETRFYKTEPIIIFDDEVRALESLKYRRIERKENEEHGIL